MRDRDEDKVTVEITKSWSDLTDQEKLQATGQTLFGARWISPLARKLQVSAPYLNQVLHRRRALGVEQRRTLSRLCGEAARDVSHRFNLLVALERHWWSTAQKGYRPDNLIPRSRSKPDSPEE